MTAFHRLLLPIAAFVFSVALAPAAKKSYNFSGSVKVNAAGAKSGAGGLLLSAEAIVRSGPYSEVENDVDWSAPSAPIKPNGDFNIELTTATLTAEIEFTGPSLRRARFPLEHRFLKDATSRPSFKLDVGVSIPLSLIDGTTSAPLSGVVLGPIFPADDAYGEVMERTFPFFERSGPDGRATLRGLVTDTGYTFQTNLPGYVRRRFTFLAPPTAPLHLEPGGARLAGKLVGDRSRKIVPNEVVLLMGGPEALTVYSRADGEGHFSFDGLPAGDYRLTPYIPNLGDIPFSSFTVGKETSLGGLVLAVPEGILISGQVVDQETGVAISNVDLEMRKYRTTTDALGRFQLVKVFGPWPLPLAAAHPDYQLLEEDQDSATRSINGADMRDISGLTLRLRKRRYLEVLTVVADAPTTPSTANFTPLALELWARTPQGETLMERFQVTQPEQVFPLTSALPRLAFARSTTGLATELHHLNIDLASTTTTLLLQPLPGARLAGYIRFEDGPPAPPCVLKLYSGLPSGDVPWMTLNPDETTGDFSQTSLPMATVTAAFERPDGSVILSRTIDFLPDATTDLKETLSRGAVFAGTAVRPEGSAVPQIPLRIYAKDTRDAPINVLVVTDGEGVFRLEGLSGTSIKQVTVQHSEWAPVDLRDVPIPVTDYKLKLSPRAGIRVTIDGGMPDLRTAYCQLLMGSERVDAMNVRQWYYDQDVQQSFGGGNTTILNSRSAGRVRVAAFSGGRWDVSQAFEWSGGDAEKDIVLSPGRKARVDLVIKGLSPEAFTGAEVSLTNTALRQPATRLQRDAANNTITADDLTAGEYLILVSTSNGEFRYLNNVDVGGGETKRLEMNFEGDLAGIDGIVLMETDAGGKEPLRGAIVRLFGEGGGEPTPMGEEKTGSDGEFAFDLLQPGQGIVLIADFEGIQTEKRVSDLIADEPIEILIPRSVKVRFIVPSPLRAQLARTPLILNHEGAAGTVVLSGAEVEKDRRLASGKWRVLVGESALGTITVPSRGASAEITLPSPAP